MVKNVIITILAIVSIVSSGVAYHEHKIVTDQNLVGCHDPDYK